ncbi:hypothetical protein [Hymenobacter sp. YC55]|uniref:hypothetical protein n=1 Tax=Hymenobacter sp. YC55 TaxID=3034019 RepID=UPI0023F912F7|nr:hypothetical protein [Hymenobacter sp. YC55]MDF7813771.1 hypothetical protein [Hymenobacter sp. YC55]
MALNRKNGPALLLIDIQKNFQDLAYLGKRAQPFYRRTKGRYAFSLLAAQSPAGFSRAAQFRQSHFTLMAWAAGP